MATKNYVDHSLPAVDAAWLNDVDAVTYEKVQNVTTVSPFMATVLDDTTATDARATLGLGTTDTPSFTGLNGGQLAGLRNRIINGGMAVAQRTNAITLTGTPQYGQVDRFMVWSTGSSMSGTITQTALAGTVSGFGCGTANASWTGGQFALMQRLESKNVADLNSKTITVSCKVYHNTGATRTFSIRVLRPTALDNYTTQGFIDSLDNINVPSGVATPVSFTTTLGASDATNGLAIVLVDMGAATVVSKTFLVADMQLEIGSVATPFEQRPYGMELALCQRYLPVLSAPASAIFACGFAYVSTQALFSLPFPATARVPPTGVVMTNPAAAFYIANGTGGQIATANGVFSSATNNSAMVNMGVAGGLTAGQGSYLQAYASGPASFQFTGCEL